MPRYKLTKTSYLKDRLYNAGDVVDWDQPPSLAMQPVDDAARREKESWESDRAQRRKNGKKSMVGWSPAIQQHEWKRLTKPELGIEAGDEPPLPMANVKVHGRKATKAKQRIDVREGA